MERQISYYLMDPTKNMTILVETPVPEASFPFVATELMKAEPEAEQVGFVNSGSGDAAHMLRMAGGEFCGNASMSAAVYYALQKGVTSGVMLLRVSGASDPVEASVSLQENGSWRGRVHMPHPVSIKEENFPDGSVRPVVRFEGIAHVILEEGIASDVEGSVAEPAIVGSDVRASAEELAKEWCVYLKTDALGLMFLNASHDEMEPLVYVPAAGTCIWESSCASGTTAVGAYLAGRAAERAQGAAFKLRQPGGTLEIEVTSDGNYYLSGSVVVRAHRTIEVEM